MQGPLTSLPPSACHVVRPPISAFRGAHRILFASLAAFRYGSPTGQRLQASRYSLLESYCRGFEAHGTSGRSLRETVRGAMRTAGEAAPEAVVLASQTTPPGAWCTGARLLPASTGRSTVPL